MADGKQLDSGKADGKDLLSDAQSAGSVHNESTSAGESLVSSLHERISELESLVGGKEQALHVALQGLDSAMGIEREYCVQLEGYQSRVEEFEKAVTERDKMIEQLSASLESALCTRDEFAQDGERLVQEVTQLRAQVKATSELVALRAHGGKESETDSMAQLHQRVLMLEDAGRRKDVAIKGLERQLCEQESTRKELQQKRAELSEFKTEAASHVQQLMREVERLQREGVSNRSLERQRAQQLLGLQQQHERELNAQLGAQRAQLEERFGRQLARIQEKHRLQLSEHSGGKLSLPDAISLPISFSSPSSSVGSGDQLQQQMQDMSERMLLLVSEREDLIAQLTLYKDQARRLSEQLLNRSAEGCAGPTSLDSLDKDFPTRESQDKSTSLQGTAEVQEAAVSADTSWKEKVDSLTLELKKVTELAQTYRLRLGECQDVYAKEISALNEAHVQEITALKERLEGTRESKELEIWTEARLQDVPSSIKEQEVLRRKAADFEEELKVLREAFDHQKEVLQRQSSDLQKLSKELLEKERLELTLKEEIVVLNDRINFISGDKLYKDQVDRQNEIIQQKIQIEDLLKKKILEKEKIEFDLRQTLEKETTNFKTQLNDLNAQILQAKKIEDLLRSKLTENEQAREVVQNELMLVKCALEEVKAQSEANALNKQSFEHTQSEEKITSDYETREALLNKREAEEKLERELETVQKELLVLKTSTEHQEQLSKEEINRLIVLVKEKEKTEADLRAELAILEDEQKHLQRLNSELEERLQSEQRLQDELLEAAKMHKEKVDVLSAKMNELMSQQNSLNNEALSMKQEIDSQKLYINDLELMKEQVTQSSRAKELLIEDLSLCVKSLTEENTSYQHKLELLNKRLDDECNRVDEDTARREVYEEEIAKHKLFIKDLQGQLEEALSNRCSHLEPSNFCKDQVDSGDNIFTRETSIKNEEELAKELQKTKSELTSHKQMVEKLNQEILLKEKEKCVFSSQLELVNEEVVNLRNQVSELSQARDRVVKENELNLEELCEMKFTLAQIKENHAKETAGFINKLQHLESDQEDKNNVIQKLNTEIMEWTCNFGGPKKTLLEGQEKEESMKIWKNKENEDDPKAVDEEVLDDSVNGTSPQNRIQDRTSNRDSLNFSSISETELLQLENKLQAALNEKNKIEKSFKDHIAKLDETHQQEIMMYEEQLKSAHLKLEEILNIHSSCSIERDELHDRINKLTQDRAKISHENKLKVSAVDLNDVSKAHGCCQSEMVAFESLVSSFDTVKKENESNKHQLMEMLGKLGQISKLHCNCLTIRQKLEEYLKSVSSGSTENASQYKNLKLVIETFSYVCGELEELTKLHKKYTSEKEVFLSKNADVEGALEEMTCVIAANIKECEQTRKYIKLLGVNLASEIAKIKVEIHNIMNVCSPSEEYAVEDKLCKSDNSESVVPFTVCNDEQNTIEECSEKEKSLQKYLDCFISLREELALLRNHVERSVGDPNSATKKAINSENLQNEKESSLNVCIGKLQEDLYKSEEEKKGLKEELENLTVKLLSAQSLLAGKLEADNSFQREASEMHAELNRCNRCQDLGNEISNQNLILSEIRKKLKDSECEKDELASRFNCLEEEAEKKLKEAQDEKENAINKLSRFQQEMEMKLKDVEKEREYAVNKWNRLEADVKEKLSESSLGMEDALSKYNQLKEVHEQVLLEKVGLEEMIEVLKQETDHHHLMNNKISRLEKLLKMSENAQNAVVYEYNTLKGNHSKLEADKKRLEELLEKTKGELIRLQENPNENVGTVTQAKDFEGHGGRSPVEKGIQEGLVSAKEETCSSQDNCSASHDTGTAVETPHFTAAEDPSGLDVSSVTAAGDAAGLLKANRSAHAVLQLFQRCAVLEAAKKALSAECEALRQRQAEWEAKELLFYEEVAAGNSRCEALEQHLQEARSQLSAYGAIEGSNLQLKCELTALNGQNSALKAELASLEGQLAALLEELQRMKDAAGKQLDSENESLSKKLMLKEAEVAVVQEKLVASERQGQSLKLRMEALATAKEELLKQFEVVVEESRSLRQQLEGAWEERMEVEEQLGRVRCELTIAGVCGKAKGRQLTRAAPGDAPASASASGLGCELHSVVEEMVQEMTSLRLALNQEISFKEQLQVEVRDLLSRCNVKLGEDCSGKSLLAQLAACREQRWGVLDAVGSDGALQEALFQQKEQLLATLKEKSAVQEQLAIEKGDLQTCKAKMQMLEQQLLEKDLLYQEVLQQKGSLGQELQRLEERLQEREQQLQGQRRTLQAQLRAQELRLRRCQLHHRASQVEKKLEENLKEVSSENNVLPLDLQVHLENLRAELNQTHRDAVAKLKHHLEAEFALREEALKAAFEGEWYRSRSAHQYELAKLQEALVVAEKQLESVHNEELVKCWNSRGSEELTAAKAKYEQELEMICSGLDESQAHLFAVLKHLFEEFARQLISGTALLTKMESEKIMEKEKAKLALCHRRELDELRANLEEDHAKTLKAFQEKLKTGYEAVENYVFGDCSTVTSAAVMSQLHCPDSTQVAIVHLKHLLYTEYTNALREALKGWAAGWSQEMHAQLELLERALEEEVAGLHSDKTALNPSEAQRAVSADGDQDCAAGSRSLELMKQVDVSLAYAEAGVAEIRRWQGALAAGCKSSGAAACSSSARRALPTACPQANESTGGEAKECHNS